jgi:hypothetical protein
VINTERHVARVGVDSIPPDARFSLACLSRSSGRRSIVFHDLTRSLLHETSVRGRAAFHAGWEWLDRSEPGSLKAKLKDLVQLMLTRIDRREEVLKHIHHFMQEAKYQRQQRERRKGEQLQQITPLPATSSSSITESSSAAVTPAVAPSISYGLTIHHPSDLSSSVSSSVLSFLSSRRAFHTRWTYINLALLPLTACAFILPGPNVFFAWNAFRLYGHDQARRGAIEMERCVRAHEGTALLKDARAPGAAVELEYEPYDDAALDLSSLRQELGVTDTDPSVTTETNK